MLTVLDYADMTIFPTDCGHAAARGHDLLLVRTPCLTLWVPPALLVPNKQPVKECKNE